MSQLELDPELIEQALAGNRAAFQKVTEQCWGLLFVFVKQRLKDPELARDLTQESFLTAYTKRESLNKGSSFLAWLLTIAARKVIDFHRRRGARPESRLDDEMEARVIDQAVTTEESSEIAESGREVHDALSHLDDRYRTVLILRYWSGLSPAQIARLLVEPEGTIRNRIFRAHGKLREALLDLQSETLAPPFEEKGNDPEGHPSAVTAIPEDPTAGVGDSEVA